MASSTSKDDGPEIEPSLKLVLACLGRYRYQYKRKRILYQRDFELQQQVENERKAHEKKRQDEADVRLYAERARKAACERQVRKWQKERERKHVKTFSRVDLLTVGHREKYYKYLLAERFWEREVPHQEDERAEQQAQENHEAGLREMKKWFSALWLKHIDVKLDREPRYLEGYPVREVLSWPIALRRKQHKRPKGGTASTTGELPCLQCSVRKLPCSLVRRPRYDNHQPASRLLHGISRGSACSRCVRHSDRHECLILVTHVDEETSKATAHWKMVDPPSNMLPVEKNENALVEAADAVRKKWEDKRDGVVVDVMGSKTAVVKKSAFAPATLLPPKELDENEQSQKQ